MATHDAHEPGSLKEKRANMQTGTLVTIITVLLALLSFFGGRQSIQAELNKQVIEQKIRLEVVEKKLDVIERAMAENTRDHADLKAGQSDIKEKQAVLISNQQLVLKKLDILKP